MEILLIVIQFWEINKIKNVISTASFFKVLEKLMQVISCFTLQFWPCWIHKLSIFNEWMNEWMKVYFSLVSTYYYEWENVITMVIQVLKLGNNT